GGLAAHYDSKGQPRSMATRLAAAGLATLGALELVALAARALLGPLHAGVPDVVIGAAGAAGFLALAANRVTDHSAGAVDNAAGVVAVLATVDALPRDAGVGVHGGEDGHQDRKSTRLNSSHQINSYA